MDVTDSGRVIWDALKRLPLSHEEPAVLSLVSAREVEALALPLLEGSIVDRELLRTEVASRLFVDRMAAEDLGRLRAGRYYSEVWRAVSTHLSRLLSCDGSPAYKTYGQVVETAFANPYRQADSLLQHGFYEQVRLSSTPPSLLPRTESRSVLSLRGTPLPLSGDAPFQVGQLFGRAEVFSGWQVVAGESASARVVSSRARFVVGSLLNGVTVLKRAMVIGNAWDLRVYLGTVCKGFGGPLPSGLKEMALGVFVCFALNRWLPSAPAGSVEGC